MDLSQANLSFHHHVYNNGSDFIFNDGDTNYYVPSYFIVQFQLVFLTAIIMIPILGHQLYVRCIKGVSVKKHQATGMGSAEELVDLV